jgi:hypothetical protein
MANSAGSLNSKMAESLNMAAVLKLQDGVIFEYAGL